MSVKLSSAENDVSFVKAKLRSFGTEQNVQVFFRDGIANYICLSIVMVFMLPGLDFIII